MGLFDEIMSENKHENQDHLDKKITEEMNSEIDPGFDVFTEATFPETLPYLKCLTRTLTLPKGTPSGFGNLCFLYTNSIGDSIKLMNNKTNFLRAGRYPYYFYTPRYTGKLRSRAYKINQITERPAIYKEIEVKVQGVRGYKKLDLSTSNLRNTFFDMSKYLQIFNSLCGKLSPIRKVVLYWNYFKEIYNLESLKGYTNRYVLVDVSMFKLGKDLKENLSNPLFIMYYTMWKYPELIRDINMDFYFFAGKRSLRINPARVEEPKETYIRLKAEMNKLYKSVVPDIEKILDEENIKKDEAIDTVVSDTISKVIEPEADVVLTDIKKEITKTYEKKAFTGDPEKSATPQKKETIQSPQKKPDTKKEIEKEIKEKAESIKKVIEENNLDADAAKKLVNTQIETELNNDKALLEKIYRENQKDKIKQTPASSARDKMLRDKQVELKIGSMTIGDIQKKKTEDIKVPVKDVSTKLTTSNKKMGQIRFENISKTYDEEVMPKDIINVITSLNNKSIPMTLRGDIKIEDTSDELNYKDTYTFQLEDALRQRHTIKVDIPKFIDGKFMLISGNEKVIKNQLFMYPIVKTKEGEVVITTNDNKFTMTRNDRRSISSIERFAKFINTNDAVKTMIKPGNVESTNSEYVTTLEYDQLARLMVEYKFDKCNIFFSQASAREYASKKGINIPSNRLYVGQDSDDKPVFINTDTQKTVDNRTIIDIIIESLPERERNIYERIRPPKRLSYSEVTLLQQKVSLAFLLCYWEGLSTILKKAEVDYRLEARIPSQLEPNESYIKFDDCVLVYKETVPISLILNGLKIFDLSGYKIADMDSDIPYIEYFKKRYGKVSIMNSLSNHYEFAIDPITEEVLDDLNLPTKIVDVMLYASSLLADSQYTPTINQNMFRNRCHEIIPAILYESLSRAYLLYKNSAGKKKLSIPQDEVIRKLMKVPTNEDNSTLNPFLEMEQSHATSTKGFRGINLDDSYPIQKREFDPSGIGILGPSSSPDGNVGVAKTLTLEPGITSVRGYLDCKYDEKNPDKSLKELNDVNLFSIGELSIPLGATIDDPTRLGHAIKQSKHVMPVTDSAPVLMSNGMEEVARFHLSSHFAINAEEDGEVVEFNEKEKIMVIKYKSGKCRAVDLDANIVKNGGGGFYLSNILKTDLKLGDKVKKDDVIAYHKDFFTNNQYNNCRMNMGTLAKVAIMSTYNTYEDATFVTHSLSERAATEMCFCKKIVIGKNSNVDFLISKGSEIKVGDPLAIFDTSYDDSDLNDFLAALSDEQKQTVLENSRNTVPSKYSGVIEDIKIYSDVDLEDMSPSLQKIVSKYYNGINRKKKLLEKYDPESKDTIVKCGVLMNQSTSKVEPNRFGIIRGEHVEESVLVEIYIKHAEPLEVGSKIANFTGLKNTVGEVIPEGYEPYSEYRPEEEISTMIAPNSILARMTPSILLTSLGNKVVIELKNKLREIYES